MELIREKKLQFGKLKCFLDQRVWKCQRNYNVVVVNIKYWLDLLHIYIYVHTYVHTAMHSHCSDSDIS